MKKMMMVLLIAGVACMSANATQYKVVKKYAPIKNIAGFEKEVQKELDDGWVCQGGVYTDNHFFYQAMIKE